MLVTMKEILDRANKESYGVAAPNIVCESDARVAIEAAEELNAPIILDFGFAFHKDIYALGDFVTKMAQQASVPVALNLDHGGEYKQFIAAIRAGFSSVMVDRSSLSFDENVEQVSEIVKIAHAVGVSVEAELGHVGMANNYDVDGSANLTEPEMAKEYIDKTGVDCLAVAVGTAHGAYANGQQPKLDYERLQEIKKATGAPLVLHGGSGTGDEALHKACQLGINKVNVSNDLCKAAYQAVMNADLSGNNVYFLYSTLFNGYKARLKELITCFGGEGKAWDVKTSLYSKVDKSIKGSDTF